MPDQENSITPNTKQIKTNDTKSKREQRDDNLSEQEMWGWVWCNCQFVDDQYPTEDLDVLQVKWNTLREDTACLDSFLMFFDFKLTTNESITFEKRSGERTTGLLKWKKILNILERSENNTIKDRKDNKIKTSSVYATLPEIHLPDTRGNRKDNA